jgi:hypothetical protein
MARSFVIFACLSTAVMQASSRVIANFDKASFLSNFARCERPRDQAKMLAMGLVDVSFPLHETMINAINTVGVIENAW